MAESQQHGRGHSDSAARKINWDGAETPINHGINDQPQLVGRIS